jgi:cytidine deaminase
MTDHELVQTALSMRNFSHAPYSNFHVGAALLCGDGRVFTGCNVESAAYGCTICAERTALFKAVSEGCASGFTAIAIAGQGEEFCWPCGACRQLLFEFAPRLRVLAAREDGSWMESTMEELLPHGFGANNLK